MILFLPLGQVFVLFPSLQQNGKKEIQKLSIDYYKKPILNLNLIQVRKKEKELQLKKTQLISNYPGGINDLKMQFSVL